MPCHGLCLARVHMSEHDFLLYLFIFLFRELSPFSFLVDLPQVIPSVLWLSYSVSLYLSVMSCPWESYRRVFDMHPHTYVCARIWAVQSQRSFWFQRVHTLPLTHSHWFCLSLAVEVHPLVPTVTHCQDLLLAVPRMGMTPIVIMLGISFPDWPVMERKASDD